MYVSNKHIYRYVVMNEVINIVFNDGVVGVAVLDKYENPELDNFGYWYHKKQPNAHLAEGQQKIFRSLINSINTRTRVTQCKYTCDNRFKNCVNDAIFYLREE